MKFRDIPEIDYGSYMVEVSLRYLPVQMDDFVKDRKLNIVPDFQRGHIWTEEQQIKFVEFVLHGGESGLDIYFNHPGWNTGGDQDFVLVDGLQRITACLRFLQDEIPAFGLKRSQFEDDLSYHRGRLRFHVNTLKTRAEVLDWYLAMNSGGTIHSPEEIERVRNLRKAEEIS